VGPPPFFQGAPLVVLFDIRRGGHVDIIDSVGTPSFCAFPAASKQ
jgi:hypothetical protein